MGFGEGWWVTGRLPRPAWASSGLTARGFWHGQSRSGPGWGCQEGCGRGIDAHIGIDEIPLCIVDNKLAIRRHPGWLDGAAGGLRLESDRTRGPSNYAPYIRPRHFGRGVQIRGIDGPNPRAGSDIQDALRVFQRSQKDLVVEGFEHNLVVQIQTVLLFLQSTSADSLAGKNTAARGGPTSSVGITFLSRPK